MSRKKSEPQTKKSVTRIGENLKAYLKEKGWRQTLLAEAAKIAPNTVSEVINGVYDPGAEILERIIRNTDINPLFLFTGEGPKTISTGTNQQQSIADADIDPITRDLLDKTHRILSIHTSAAREALASNINYLFDSVRREMVLSTLDDEWGPKVKEIFGSTFRDIMRKVDERLSLRRASPDPIKGEAPAPEVDQGTSSQLNQSEQEKLLPRRYTKVHVK